MEKNNLTSQLVSIITVSFNSSKTIEQTILSVLQQTYSPIEYIIIDGGSTDGTIEIVKKYADRIAYWVSEPDKGIYDAMNKGVQASHGELIGIINSDDWYDLDAIEKVVKLFEKKGGVDVIHGGIRFYENERYKTKYCPKIEEINLCMIPHPACFISKKAYEKFGLYNTDFRIAADYDLVARIYAQKGKFIHCDQLLANLRMGGASDVENDKGQQESLHIKEKYNLHYQPSFLKKVKRRIKSLIQIN